MKRTPLILAVILILTALLPGCRERIVYTGPGDWLLLVDDPDDGNVPYNAHYLYVDADFSDEILEFKVESYGSIPDATRDVQFAVYFDTDRDATTGLSTSAGWGDNATPNDIGADFMMFVGSDTADGGLVNENLIFAWDITLATPGWTEIGQVGAPYQPANGDSVKGTISLDILGNPTGQIDVVAILLCAPTDPTNLYYDHIPDQNEGHATIDLDNGSVAQTSSQSAGVAINPSSGRRVSLITGRKITPEEAR
ncbi:hypothetical protein GH141_00180 [bacterium]|nr:hypothetical protein [bacterium]